MTVSLKAPPQASLLISEWSQDKKALELLQVLVQHTSGPWPSLADVRGHPASPGTLAVLGLYRGHF